MIKVPDLPDRPPQLCAGCPHKSTFQAVKAALENRENSLVTSDIGCYALGALPPLSATETILCMGASIGMAKGAVEAGFVNVVATIGDSTFFHSGIPPLIDAVAAHTKIVVIIMDNSTTAMTGGQAPPLPSLQIPEIVKGLGVIPEQIKVIRPVLQLRETNKEIIKTALDYDGVSVIIAKRKCFRSLKKYK